MSASTLDLIFNFWTIVIQFTIYNAAVQFHTYNHFNDFIFESKVTAVTIFICNFRLPIKV